MVALVEKMLDLNRRLAAAKAPHEKEVLAGMIDATDRDLKTPPPNPPPPAPPTP